MLGGYNIATLVELLDDEQLATDAAKELTHTLLMFDAFHDVAEKADNGNPLPRRRCCSLGLTRSGSRAKRKFQKNSRSQYSRCREKPTPTTCLRRRPGQDRIFPYTPRQCTRIRVKASPTPRPKLLSCRKSRLPRRAGGRRHGNRLIT